MTRDEFLKTFTKLLPGYAPSRESLARIKEVNLLIVIGPSGVGKTSIIDRMGLHYVPIDTTRSARPEEKDGIDMFFRTDYDQIISDIKAGEFMQFVAGVSGDFYGTRAANYPSHGWAIMPIIYYEVQTFRRLGFKQTLSVFITPPSCEEWMRRMDNHPLSEEQRSKRLVEAGHSFDFALSDSQTHFILNDKIEDAVDQAKQLLNGKVDEQREAAAYKAAQSSYKTLITK